MTKRSRAIVVVWSLALLAWRAPLVRAQPSQPVAVGPGQAVEGVIHNVGDERYRLAFGASGNATVEVSGFPPECTLQVGSQGFQESDASPVDWTEGPGRSIRHSFRVQAGRPGVIWVMLRSRVSSVSSGSWSGVACSNDGPWYTAPARGSGGDAGPSSFEGRQVRPPIAFTLVAVVGGTPGPPASMPPARPPQPPSTQPPSSTYPPPPTNPPPNSGPTRPGGWPPSNTGSTRGEPGPVPRDAGGGVAGGFAVFSALGVSFEYPQAWSSASSGSSSYRFSGRSAPANELVATLKVVAKAPNTSALQQLLAVHEQLTDAGADLLQLGPTQVGGQEAGFASHQYTARNAQGATVPFNHVQLVLDHGGNYYLVSFVAPREVFVNQKPGFVRVVNTWKFLTAAPAQAEESAWKKLGRRMDDWSRKGSTGSEPPPPSQPQPPSQPPSNPQPRSEPAGGSQESVVAEYRSLLPQVLQKEKKPWHTRFEFVANAVPQGAGWHVDYKTYCAIETGPDAGKDYSCFEYDAVLDFGQIKSGVADLKRRLGQ